MAISYDNATNGGYNTASYSHVCTGGNLVLIAAITCLTTSTPTCTYGGVSLTSVGSRSNNKGWSTYIFALLSPASGSNTFLISSAGSDYTSGVTSYSGVKQSSFPDSSSSTDGGNNNSPVSGTTTVVASNCWTWAVAFIAAGAGPYTLTSDKTDRTTGAITGSNGEKYRIADSNATVSTGSNSISFTGSGGANFDISVFILSMAPAPTAGGGGFFLKMI